MSDQHLEVEQPILEVVEEGANVRTVKIFDPFASDDDPQMREVSIEDLEKQSLRDHAE